MADLKAQRKAVPIGSLEHWPGNARVHDMEVLKESLETHGQYKPLVVQAGTNRVLAGNGTLAAARELGWKKVRVEFIEVNDEQARKIVLVDNRASDLAGYDDELLAAIFEPLDDLVGTGFDDQAVAKLVRSLALNGGGLTDPDEVPEAPEEPVTKRGDVWTLGDHRLVCGDATDRATYEALLDGDEDAPTLCWTDPPYGVNYEGKTADKLTIEADDAAGLENLLKGAFMALDGALAEGAAIYVAHPAGPNSLVFARAFIDVGWRLHQTLVWVKNSIVLGRSDYHYKHEPLLYGYKAGGGRRGRGGKGWYGDNKQASVFEVDRPSASREHPTAKPVDLVGIHIRNSAAPGEIVIDPFGGSGSTLIAAEVAGNPCRLIELSAAYCDVVARRYQNFTGNLPERGGKPHDFSDDDGDA